MNTDERIAALEERVRLLEKENRRLLEEAGWVPGTLLMDQHETIDRESEE
jgi:hypothetical protein